VLGFIKSRRSHILSRVWPCSCLERLSFNAAMSQTQSSSSYCNNCVQCSVPSSRTQGLRLICDCGEAVVLRIARAPRNVSRNFWGCANYKVRLI